MTILEILTLLASMILVTIVVIILIISLAQVAFEILDFASAIFDEIRIKAKRYINKFFDGKSL